MKALTVTDAYLSDPCDSVIEDNAMPMPASMHISQVLLLADANKPTVYWHKAQLASSDEPGCASLTVVNDSYHLSPQVLLSTKVAVMHLTSIPFHALWYRSVERRQWAPAA